MGAFVEYQRNCFGLIYRATLIDGLINPYSIKHHDEMGYERKESTKGWDVAIKIMPTNSSEVFKEDFNPTANEVYEIVEELQKVCDTKSTRESAIRKGKRKQFFELDKHIKEMLKKDSTTNHSTTTTITRLVYLI
ncbi:hypothetical protein G9A89_017564 [Geosiphon pyriformis]|nr:hypothetical protein G9A89_017564 [Geosiphon pyriformis]